LCQRSYRLCPGKAGVKNFMTTELPYNNIVNQILKKYTRKLLEKISRLRQKKVRFQKHNILCLGYTQIIQVFPQEIHRSPGREALNR